MTDLDALLQPIGPDNPAGRDLRNAIGETPLAVAKELRRQDDPNLVPPGVEPKLADWRSLAEVCSEALASDSKDLELAVYLVEGMTWTNGLAGLADGLQLLDGLLEQFWPQIHPGIEEDGELDHAFRARWLNWLNHHQRMGDFDSYGDFLTAVRSVPLTGGDPDESLSLVDFEDAMQMERFSRINAARFEEMSQAGKTTRDQWEAAFQSAPADLRDGNRERSELCLQRLEQLDSRCRELFGDSGEEPSFHKFRDVLEQIRDLHVSGGGDGGDEDGGGDTNGEDGGGTTGGGGGGGRLQTRADAIKRLREVAGFLRQTEPHSPVWYLIDRSVAWLNMSFEELMVDFIKASDTIDSMRSTLGLPLIDD